MHVSLRLLGKTASNFIKGHTNTPFLYDSGKMESEGHVCGSEYKCSFFRLSVASGRKSFMVSSKSPACYSSAFVS